MSMIRRLFLLSITLMSIAPVVTPFNVFSNVNYGDILFLLLSPFFIFNEKRKLDILLCSPLIFMSLYLLSSTYAVFFLDFIHDINIGFILRFLYYFFIVYVISKFVVDSASFQNVLKSVLIGLTISLIITWFVWSITPVYLGAIPMLHTVHDFAVFPINRNYIGFFIAIGSGLSFALLLIDKHRYKAIYLSVLLFFLFSSLFTFSKGTWLSSYFLIVIYSIRRKPILSCSLFLIGFISVLLLYGSGEGFTYELIDRMTERVEGSANTNNDRYDYAVEALLIGLLHFPFGVGAEGYFDAAVNHGFHQTKDPHNAILWVFSESGIFGLIFFIAILLLICINIFQNRHKNRDEVILLLGIFVPLFLNIPFQGTPFSMKYLWIIISLTISLRYLYCEKNSPYNYRPSTGRC